MRQRIQAIIIQDNNILFVRDEGAPHYYPPGGGIDEGENHMSAMRRELKEELGVDLLEMTYFSSYDEMNVMRNYPQREHNYFVTYTGTPVPSTEIVDVQWVSWEEIEAGKYPMPPALYEELLVVLKSQNHFDISKTLS